MSSSGPSPWPDGSGDPDRPLSSRVVARLRSQRLATTARVTGSRDGGHRSTRRGHSLEFADQRPYVAGDDPRSLDLASSRRHGRLLVRVHEAEDETALRVVVDGSRSMAFGGKLVMATDVARALAHVATHGGDRLRVVVAGHGGAVRASPWVRGASAEHALRPTLATVDRTPVDDGDAPGPAALLAAIGRARGEGPAGPVVLVSDLLVPDWAGVLHALGTGPGGAVLVHVLGREDREPWLDGSLDGDLDLVDAETGAVVSIAATDRVLAEHALALAAWQADVVAEGARRGVAIVAADDRDDVADLVTVGLRRVGLVA